MVLMDSHQGVDVTGSRQVLRDVNTEISVKGLYPAPKQYLLNSSSLRLWYVNVQLQHAPLWFILNTMFLHFQQLGVHSVVIAACMYT